MKKIALISFLMFFVHFFILIVLFTRLNAYIPKHYESNDRGIFTLIAFYLTFLLYALSVILVIVEKLMRVKYKWGMYFLLYLNCLSVFCINAFYQYHLFNNPKCFVTSSIVIILIYLLFELMVTFYVTKILYTKNKSN
ncbi:hypothetical protein SAMN05444146_1245 [Flavobacterium johnsoniae]|jgi:hypothetical protein|nr:hypothetical protein B0A63_01575 [Flavobacterium johnsoniae UW101]SHK35592.1 hypothetical protein SAMN05444146_1245 [Flavobacterium johnsoniae]